MTNDFLPEGYSTPTGSDDYCKFKPGENKIRILSKPVILWQDWADKKPLRFPFDKKPAAAIDPAKPIKLCWALLIWNYNDKKIQIVEISQKGIILSLEALAKNEAWGNPNKYDIKITKSGSGMDTEYLVTPIPPSTVTDEIKAAYRAKPCVLDRLLTGQDPFATSVPLTQETIVAAALNEPVAVKNLNPDANSEPF